MVNSILLKKMETNFSHILQNPSAKIYSSETKEIIEIEDRPLVMCPLCARLFFTDLEEDTIHLSNEHTPPHKLGGDINSITCRTCNNMLGGKVDSELIRQVKLAAVLSGESPNLNYKTRLERETLCATIGETGESIWLNLSRQQDTWYMLYPEKEQTWGGKFFEGFMKGDKFQLKFTFSSHAIGVSLLKIAYLTAFAHFGYGFLFNRNINVNLMMMYQFSHPEEKVFSLKHWIDDNIPDEYLGVNILVNPIELRAFVVVVDLVMGKHKQRHAVVLPGFRKNWRKTFNELTCGVEFSMFKCPDIDFLQSTYAAADMWDEMFDGDSDVNK